MKLFDHPQKWFMAKFDRFESMIQDSTQMKGFKECDRKYFYRFVLGFVPRMTMYQVNLDWGTARHKFRQTLEESNGDVALATEVALSVKLAIPHQDTPAAKYAYLNKSLLIRACALDYNNWLKEKEQGKIKVIPNSIEQSINVQLPDGSYTGGRVDQMIEYNGLWDRDWKTSSKPEKEFAKEKDPDDQSTRYIYMISKLHGDIIRGVMFHVLFTSFTQKEGAKIDIYTHIVSKTPKQLEMWEREQIHLNKQLKLNRDTDIWPMREGKNCKYCDYKRVCMANNEQSQMAQLESNFKIQPWDFLYVTQLGEVE